MGDSILPDLKQISDININAPHLLALSLRLYVNYRLGSYTDIQRAIYTAATGLRKHRSFIRLIFACAFYHCEAGSGDAADEYFTILKDHRAFLKNEDQLLYGVYIYIQAVYDLNIRERRSVKKHIKAIYELKNKCGSHYLDLLLGDINYRIGEYEEALLNIEDSYEKGCRSPLIYIIYGDILNKGITDLTGYLFIPYMKWSLQKRAVRPALIEDNAELIDGLIGGQLNFFKKLYRKTESEVLLGLICENMLSANDTSYEAFLLYKLAERKQFIIPGLNNAIIYCACKYQDEDVGIYSITRFLKNEMLPNELMPFISHLMLSKPQFGALMDDFNLKNRILQYGAYALDSNLNGKIYNSIYAYILFNICGENGDTALAERIESILFNDLFTVIINIEDLESGYVWVFENEKNRMETYPVESGKAVIKSAACNMNITILDDSQKTVLRKKYSYERLVAAGGEWLYKYFIEKGYLDENLYIALSGIYVKGDEIKEEHIDTLDKTLEIGCISMEFRTQVGAALGNILSMLHRHDKALTYFNEVDESRLNGRYIEIMLLAFINTANYEKAIRLIVRKREFISDKALSQAIKVLSADKKFHPIIADAAYELLIKNSYDAKLLEIVTANYCGACGDWFTLYESLDRIGIYHIPLDEKILEDSFYIRNFSAKTQDVFHRLYHIYPESKIISRFIYYACFEMCANLICPNYEVISDLENAYENSRDKIIAYALSRIYLKYNISTFASGNILKNVVLLMEEDNIILPEFKDVKDKNLITPYIEKNQPFIYKSASDKKVYLNYKINGTAEFMRKEMNHLAFGIFIAIIPMFFDEEAVYYISEEIKTGSINTKEAVFKNTRVNIKSKPDDLYFQINNALIYSQMFKYNEAEKIVTELLRDKKAIIGKIL